MGVCKRRRSAGWQHLIAGAALATALAVGCTSSSRPARVVEATPPRPAAAEAKRAPAAAEIRSIELREGAPEVFVDVKASAALVWTSFRNAQGQVIVELPNAVPGQGIADLAPESGLVASLKVERQNDGTRPMTRLTVATRQEVEHSVVADGQNLHIRLMPVDGDKQASLSFEPVAAAPPGAPVNPPPAERKEPAPAAAPPAAAPEAAAPAPALASPAPPAPSVTTEPMPATPPAAVRAGTPDEPVVGPAPTGRPATRLDAIEVFSSQGGAVVKISGDGEFPYATFALGDPDRFVIDLVGVLNHSPRPTVSVNAGPVSRVRVAQFKPQPTPVARVVFDLQHGAVPRIERTPRSLVVSFGQAAAAATGTAGEAKAPAAAAAPAPAEAVRSQTPEAPPAAAEVAPAPPPPAAKTTQKTSKAKSSRKSSRKTDAIETLDASQASSSLTSTTTATTKSSLAPAKPASGAVTLAPAGQAPSDLQLKPAAGTPAGGTGAGGPAAGGPATPSFASQTMGQAAAEKKYVGDPIDLKVTNADVTEVLRSFAQISGLNVIVQPGVNGTVTAEMENVPWDQALEEVLKINKLGFELDGNVMRIAPTTVLREEAQERQELAAAQSLAIPLKTVMQRLSYADAVAVSALLKSGQAGLLSQRGTVIVDTRTNTLIIKELPNFLDTVIAVIEQLDTPEPQVMIEARIIETTKHFNRDLGIRWSFEGISDAAHGNTTGLIFPNNADLKGDVEVGVAHNDILNLKLGNVLNTFTLDAALQAAENEGLIHILSAPKVATLNNHAAEIQSGLQIPIQTIANNTVTVQFVNATLRLAVTPQVTAEGTILMDIDISKREPQLAFLVPGATNAPIATKDARTKLVVRDGGTAVIGGIYKVTSNESQDRIPGLANIPILGNLFKNKSKSEDNEELLIFITPRVIKL